MTRIKHNNNTQRVIIVIDRSGSMVSFKTRVMDEYRKLLREIESNAKRYNIPTDISVYTFNEMVTRHTTDPSLLPGEFRPMGSTALYAATARAIEDVNRFSSEYNDPNKSFLVYVLTDGEENASGRYAINDMQSAILRVQATDRWTIAFHLPKGYKQRFVNLSGVPSGNVSEWDQTDEGVREASVQTIGSTQSYYDARSKGATRSVDFFNVDMSKVKPKDVTSNLVDMSGKYKMYEVPKESEVKSFTEAKTGRRYIIGQTFYQLMKPETVQTTKNVLIMEKGKKAVWGGHAARQMIGLPVATAAKVNPLDLSKYDIFVESRSVNRKLPRGTKALIDTGATKDAVPTWDHTAAD